MSLEEGFQGAVYKDYATGETGAVMRPEIPGYYHGTGDVFGSALVGACESGLPLGEAVSVAVDFTVGSIMRTRASGADTRYGVDFEPGLASYALRIRSYAPVLVPAETPDDARIISSLAHDIWPKAFKGMETDEHIRYLVDTFQSPRAIMDAIGNGYRYMMLRAGNRTIGYTAYRIDDDSIFVSKMYLLEEFRGKGYASMMFDHIDGVAASEGKRLMRLEVNRSNEHSIRVYESRGFRKVSETDRDMGNGFTNHDYDMERSI